MIALAEPHRGRPRTPQPVARLGCHLPTIAASAVLVGVSLAWIGEVADAVVSSWFLAGFVGMARRVERALAWLRRFRSTDPSVTDPLARMVTDAADLCGVEAGSIDLYLSGKTHDINAYALGGHGVAITSGFATAYLSGRLSGRHATAVIVHELGHLTARTTRLDYPLWWWTLPWRIATLVVALPVRVLTGWLPGRTLGYALAPVVGTIASLRLIETGQWAGFGCVVFLGYVTCVLPMLNATLSRHGEYVADGFAAQAGLGEELAEALAVLDNSPGGLLATHPSVVARMQRLTQPRRGHWQKISRSSATDSPTKKPYLGKDICMPDPVKRREPPWPTTPGQ